MFEAIHGSAPRRAGQNLANPSGLLLGAVMMLVHIGQTDVAELVHNAWLKTIEDGVHTYDIFKEKVSKEKVGTKEFAMAVVARLGQKPSTLKAVTYESGHTMLVEPSPRKTSVRELVGVDVFLHWAAGSADDLAAALGKLNGDGLVLKTISNRGQKMWPDGNPETFATDLWGCRFQAAESGSPIQHRQIVSLLSRVSESGLDFVKTENLNTFDGKPGYTLGQGE